MIRGIFCSGLLALATSAATEPAAVPAPAGMLEVAVTDGGGCGQAAPDGPAEGAAVWTGDDRAEYRRLFWFSSRERLVPGPVEIEVRGRRVFAWVSTDVDPIVDGEPVTTCLHAQLLVLTVEPLPRGDYQWVLRQGRRADDVNLERDIAAADAAAADGSHDGSARPAGD